MEIEHLQLSTRVRNVLRNRGVTSARTLTKLSAEDLRAWRGMGTHSCHELKRALAEVGLSLRPSLVRRVAQ